MAQWFRELVDTVEDPCSVSSPHVRWLTSTHNSRSRGADVFCSLWAPAHMQFVHTEAHTHFFNNIEKLSYLVKFE